MLSLIIRDELIAAFQKRKRTAAHQLKKETQTVQRSRILQSPLLAGTTLLREHGSSSRYQLLEARGSALATQFRATELLNLKSCESCGRRETIYDFVTDKESNHIMLGLGSENFGRLRYLTDFVRPSARDIIGFRSNISSISLTLSRAVAVTSATYTQPGNLFIGRLSEPTPNPSSDDDLPHILDSPTPTFMLLGPPETSLYSSAPSPPGGTDMLAVGGSEQIYLLGASGTLLQTHTVNSPLRSIDWLSQNVAVGGTRKRTIMLWDARAGGQVTRFWHPSGVTGIRSLGDSSQIVVTGFDGIGLYDVRMPRNMTECSPAPPSSSSRYPKSFSAAVLRIPFKTERPVTTLDVSRSAGLIATGADDNVIQLHSLRTGKLVKELGTSSKAAAAMALGWNRPPWVQRGGEFEHYTRLRFEERDEVGGGAARGAGVALLACQGSVLREWSWGGEVDDEG